MPLSLDCVSCLFLSGLFAFPSPFSFFISLVFWFTEGQHLSTIQTNHALSTKSASPAVRHLSCVNYVTGLTLSSLTRAFVVRHVSPPESGPWFTNQPCVQCALGNPTHNSAMVTERMKTSALWQQINGSLSPRISRTLNKI